MALAEGTTAGFAGVYPLLRTMEEQGKVRRGYFVAGLGAAQFARSGAIDQLRLPPDPDPAVLVLAATDPAQPYGAVLPWPATAGRASRSAGCRVILRDGTAHGFVDRAGRSLLIFDGADLVVVAAGLAFIGRWRLRRLELASVNGAPLAEHPLAGLLAADGWRISYRGMRPPEA